MLILLPAIWLLASAVFLLSKSIPGSATEMQFEQAAESANSSAKAEARQRAYRQLLHRTGQDLPLFYFRVGTVAEPDTLHEIFPENDRVALKKLVHTYGNWPEISAYYLALQQFEKILPGQNIPLETKRKSLQFAGQLLETSDPVKARKTFTALQKMLCFPAEKVLCDDLVNLQARFENVVAAQKPALNYQPKFFWYGTQNQYHRWFGNLLRSNLGYSSRDMRPVSEVISEAFEVTIWLALATFVLVAVSGPAIAMVLSRKSMHKSRGMVLGFLYALESVPLFIVALVFLSVAGYLGWFGSNPEETGMGLAIAVLALVNLPYFTTQAFVALQGELRENYVLTAKAKGLSENKVLLQHAFRNTLLPLITLLADFFPVLLAGTVVLEIIFSLPGMGRLLVSAVLARDYEIIAGLVLLTGLLKMLAHLLADLFYNLADPRLRN
ncbi:ABC transporter permease [Adhaeribacter sp. BT258]|uniref:ABC transporter permease n=1 Tax=Adhaeribacter terrigena TaxID=2793070 RepID=A0ABS1C1S0_9BACT|nr:ABC transporter permease [Adhaeribacter terrigena]MBK0403332.1 ABC transporter permease [Adhaeribacter terrigena]